MSSASFSFGNHNAGGFHGHGNGGGDDLMEGREGRMEGGRRAAMDTGGANGQRQHSEGSRGSSSSALSPTTAGSLSSFASSLDGRGARGGGAGGAGGAGGVGLSADQRRIAELEKALEAERHRSSKLETSLMQLTG